MKTFFKELPVILQTLRKFKFQSHKHQINLTGLPASTRTPSSQTSNPETQNQEMTQAGLDSIEHHSYFPPDMLSISPNSLGYCQKAFSALGLDEQSYHHVQPTWWKSSKT